MLAAHLASAFVATAVSAAAVLVGDGADIDITSFDSRWHRESIASQPARRDAGHPWNLGWRPRPRDRGVSVTLFDADPS